MRQWRVLQMLKHTGAWTIQELEACGLVVRCPGCPRPGHNLPEGWENHPDA